MNATENSYKQMQFREKVNYFSKRHKDKPRQIRIEFTRAYRKGELIRIEHPVDNTYALYIDKGNKVIKSNLVLVAAPLSENSNAIEEEVPIDITRARDKRGLHKIYVKIPILPEPEAKSPLKSHSLAIKKAA